MKVLVTGVTGQLGYDVLKECEKRGYTGIGLARDRSKVSKFPVVEVDITEEEKLNKAIHMIRPDVIIHCAAYTKVDDAEDEKNLREVFDVNAYATKNIAKIAKKIDAKMIYISTDYVFDGKGITPWKVKDYRRPLNHYGLSKYEGEIAVEELLEKYYIVRISWVFGSNGKNFIKTMYNVGQNHDEVRVVNDQIGRPTYTKDLARLLLDMAETDKYGIYHATNEGREISWYDLTCEIYKQTNMKTLVKPVTTIEYGKTKAERPKNSRLNTDKLTEQGFLPLPDWKDALSRYLIEIGAKEEKIEDNFVLKRKM